MKFHRLTVLNTFLRRIPSSGKNGTYAHVICDCGKEKDVLYSTLKKGLIISCGCYAIEARRKNGKMAVTHGQSGSRTYIAWSNMMSRCNNSNRPDYPYYGGRGIAVCDRWTSFENFVADMGERPQGMTLDRIDVNGNYEPSNCRWDSRLRQARNRRSNHVVSYKGMTGSLSEVCETFSMDQRLVWERLSRGWTIERAIEQKVHKENSA